MQKNSNRDTFKNTTIKETKSFWSEAYEWIDSAVITVMILLLVFTFLFRQVKIEGDSMNPTLETEERVIVSDVFYSPQYGDIVVISAEILNDKPIIKRVIATEGQWLQIKNGHVYVGEESDRLFRVSDEFIEPDVDTWEVIGGYDAFDFSKPIQVPDNHVFVLGDNRQDSLDSRAASIIGFVDCRQILGKALYRVYPFDKIGSIY